MEDYVLLRKHEKIQEEEKNKMVNDGADQPVQTESQDETLERKKGRGPTLMNNVYTRRPDEKKIIKLNCELQAIADDDKVLSEFRNFLGTLSRQSVPLDCINWRRFPEKRKDELWSFVKTKYDIPEEGRTYTLRTIGALWRLHKARIKTDHYHKYDNDDDRLKNRPDVIPVEEFKVLLNYWGDEEVQRRSRENAENRQKIVETHTAGRKSFAQIGEQIKIEKNIPPEQLAPKGEIYEKTRKRDPKCKYKTKIDEEDDNGEPVKKPSHGPNWLLGRSGKCRTTKKAQEEKLLTTSTANVDELRKTITKEVMAEMDRKICEKMKRIMEKLGDINPDFKNLDVEELWADDASEDDEEDNGVEENKSEEDDIGEEGDGHEDDNN
nr:PREDICTED: uncharacterized protein LOC108207323 [Daucus carota subsp. sativus]